MSAGGLARRSILVLIGEAVPALAALLVIPALLERLGSARLGALSLAWTIVGTLGLVDLGLGRAITRLVASSGPDDDQMEIAADVRTGVWATIALGSLAAAVFAVATPLIVAGLGSSLVDLKDETHIMCLMLAFVLPVVTASAAFRGVLEGLGRFEDLAPIRSAVGGAMFVAPWIVSWRSVHLGALAASLVAVRLVGLWLLVRATTRANRGRAIGVGLDLTRLGELLRFGGWLTVSNAVSPLLVTADRFVVGSTMTLSTVAGYVAPLEIVERAGILPGSVATALFASSAAQVSPQRRAELFAAGLKLALVAILPVVWIGVAWAPELLRAWLGIELAAVATPVLRLASIGMLLNAIGRVSLPVVQASGRPDLAAKLHVAEFIIYLPILWLASRQWGVVGAAASWTLRVAMDALALVLIASRLVGVPVRGIERIGIGVGLALLICAGGWLIASPLMRAVSSVALIPALVFLGFGLFTQVERADLRRMFFRAGLP